MRVAVVATALSCSFIGLSIADPAIAAAIRKPSNIPPQELALALQTLAKDRDFQIVCRGANKACIARRSPAPAARSRRPSQESNTPLACTGYCATPNPISSVRRSLSHPRRGTASGSSRASATTSTSFSATTPTTIPALSSFRATGWCSQLQALGRHEPPGIAPLQSTRVASVAAAARDRHA